MLKNITTQKPRSQTIVKNHTGGLCPSPETCLVFQVTKRCSQVVIWGFQTLCASQHVLVTEVVFVRFLGGVCVVRSRYTVASERIETHVYQLDFVFK